MNKKEFIKKKIAAGDTRSYNEIQADLELQLWSENKQALPIARYGNPKNNRKRTNGRKIQVVAGKQIKHLV